MKKNEENSWNFHSIGSNFPSNSNNNLHDIEINQAGGSRRHLPAENHSDEEVIEIDEE
jgi:hypothetical protein